MRGKVLIGPIHFHREPITSSPAAGKLGRTKSHSASNLSKISVIEYHNMQPAAKPREDRSSSCGNISAKSASGGVPKNKYAHVQSKVKQYIQDIKNENEQKVRTKTKIHPILSTLFSYQYSKDPLIYPTLINTDSDNDSLGMGAFNTIPIVCQW